VTETKYDKYFITELQYRDVVQDPPQPADWRTRILYLDDNVLKGALYLSCCWYTPGGARDLHPEPHKHDFDEVLGFIGNNPEAPTDLGAEIELWIDGEKHLINKSCLVFIPKGLPHCPMRTIRTDRQVLHFSTGPSGKHGKLPVNV
jgi:hypothetical protein